MAEVRYIPVTGATFKRPFKVSGDQLTYTDNAPSDGSGPHDVVWKRVK